MSIVKMKKLSVLAMSAHKDELLNSLLHLGCVEISEPDTGSIDPKWHDMFRRTQTASVETRRATADADKALDALKRYGGVKDGMFIKRRDVSEAEFLSDEAAEEAKKICDAVCAELKELSRAQTAASRLESRRDSLIPWIPMDMPLEKLQSPDVVYRPGTCALAADAATIRARLEEIDAAAEFIEFGADRIQKYCLLVCCTADEKASMEILRTYGFNSAPLQNLKGTPSENIASLEKQMEDNKALQDEIIARIAAYAPEADKIRLYTDRLGVEGMKNRSAENMLTNGTVTMFEGWVPVENLPETEKALDAMECVYELTDPDMDNCDDVPVKLKNNRITKPLNMVTEMYALPKYSNVDPNPLMAPFFILFYGIMMADIAYGIMMIIAGVLITKKFHPKGTSGNLFGLMTLCGISTTIMGCLTGGFFGNFLTQAVDLVSPGTVFELPSLITPLDDTLIILIGAMALGMVQIITGMAISFIRKLKSGQYLDAVLNELTWWIVFVGIALFALKVTNIVLWIGVALVIAGPIITEKGFGKVTGIFASLYNNVTGYFGDILSYSRLMALMLAGSVIAEVFNTLGTITGNIVTYTIIALVGNMLNFALNLLGCYVHDLRLQCLEYFGKFYEDGGKPFRPLSMDSTKYVDVT